MADINHPLERRIKLLKGQGGPSNKCESKMAISHILGFSSRSLKQQLKGIIEVLNSISWLKMGNNGAVFVLNGESEFVLAAEITQKTYAESRYTSKKPFRKCLEEESFDLNNVQFEKNQINDQNLDFIQPSTQGQFSIPLVDNNTNIVGLLMLDRQASADTHQEEEDLFKMIGQTLASNLQNKTLEFRVEINRLRLQHAQQEILHKLVTAAEFRDNETGEHIRRMTQYCVAIGKGFGLGKKELQLLEQAAPMHDVGKVGIPDGVLLKPGKLNEEEFSIIEKHTLIGGRILSGTHPLIVASRQIALTHHEKWDGSGYPHGLVGEDIPLFGRICAIADVFDALTTARPYKEAWPVEKAIALINDNSGKHFDPKLVDIFNSVLYEILEIREIFTNRAHGGVQNKMDEVSSDKKIPGWNNSLSIGVEAIDDQHKYLLLLIDHINQASEQFAPKEIVKAILDLKSYAEVHFSHEEYLMGKNEYPDLKNHIKEHKSFFETIDHFLDDLEEFPLATTSEMSVFLNNWLTHHIRTIDGQFGQFLKAETKRKQGKQALVV